MGGFAPQIQQPQTSGGGGKGQAPARCGSKEQHWVDRVSLSNGCFATCSKTICSLLLQRHIAICVVNLNRSSSVGNA